MEYWTPILWHEAPPWGPSNKTVVPITLTLYSWVGWSYWLEAGSFSFDPTFFVKLHWSMTGVMLWLDGKRHIALSTFQHGDCLLVSQPFQADAVYRHDLIPSMKLSTVGCCSFFEHSFDVDWQITVWAAVPPDNAEPQSVWPPFQCHGTCLKLRAQIAAPATSKKHLHSAFNKKKTLFTGKLDLNLRKKLIKCYIWSMALYGAETWTLRAADRKYMESFEMWCWRRMEKISWTDHVRNEEVLLRVNWQRNILYEIRKQKANWIGHILRRNCLLKQVIEGKIKGEMEVARRWGRRRKKLLDDLKDRRGYSHLKEEALDCTMWRHRFGGGFGPVVWQITEWMNDGEICC